MTLYQFKLLDTMEQAQAVWDEGVHLATRNIPGVTILLWQVDGFYVEVFYDIVEGEIIKIRSFHSTYGLEPYLKQIDLTQLL